MSDRLHRVGDRLARPGEAGKKNCGRLVPRKMSVGVSGRLNQAPTAWPMKLVARNEHRCEREQLQRVAERRKAVDARQHDKIERERRQIERQVGDAAAEHVRERAARRLRHGQAAQRRGADQERLLQDQHEGRRHDVARIAADRIEDRLQQDVGRARGGERRLDEAAIGARAARRQLGGERIDRAAMPLAVVRKMNR